MPDIPLIIAIAALGGAACSALGVWRRRNVSQWPQVEASVTDTEVVELGSRVQNREGPEQQRHYAARVHVRFQAAGREVASHNGHFDGAPAFASREQAEVYLAGYRRGMTLIIRHDPRDPARTQFGTARIPRRRIGLTLFLLGMAGFALFLSSR